MLDGDHWRTNILVDELITQALLKTMFNIIECLKPELTIEDGQYKLNYKNILVGKGDTVHNAMLDFQSNYYKKI